MSKIRKKFIENNAVGGLQLRLENDTFLRARNAADSADINVFKIDSTDVVSFAAIPKAAGTPVNAQDLVTKQYADSIAGTGATTALDNLTTTAINASLVPDSDVSYDLGDSSNAWATAFVNTVQAPSSADLVFISDNMIRLESQIDVDIKVQDEGSVRIRPVNTGGTVSPSLMLMNSNTTFGIGVRAPAALGVDYYLTLPPTAGGANQVLTTDGNGVLSWTTPSVGTTYSADGDGIQESGGVFSLELDGNTLEKSSTGLKVGTSLVDNNIASNANIALTKLAALTADRVLVSSNSGVIEPGSVTTIELAYLGGVVNPIQDQLDDKLSKQGGVMSGVIQMSSYQITGLGAPTSGNDAATKTYVDNAVSGIDLSNYLALAGGTMLGSINMGGNAITSLADPVASQDAVTKSYVDNLLNGLKWKHNVKAATTGLLPSYTVAGTTLTATANGALVIDGVTLVDGDRLLVKDETDSELNGIYFVTNGGDVGSAYVLDRAADADTAIELNSAAVFVAEGTVNGDKGFQQTNEISALGTDAVNWVQFTATNMSGHDMITLVGGEISIDLATVSGLESTNPGNSGGQLRIKLEATNPSLAINGSNELGIKFADSSLVSTNLGLALNLKGVSGIDVVGGTSINIDGSTTKINGSNQLESLKPDMRLITLTGTDITNGYVDLPVKAYADQVLMIPSGGSAAEEGVGLDYTVSEVGGVTRITFEAGLSGILASGDKLVTFFNHLN